MMPRFRASQSPDPRGVAGGGRYETEVRLANGLRRAADAAQLPAPAAQQRVVVVVRSPQHPVLQRGGERWGGRVEELPDRGGGVLRRAQHLSPLLNVRIMLHVCLGSALLTE